MTGVPVAAIEPESPDAGVVAHYGDPMREQRTLATAAGLVDRSHRGVLAVPGPDRLTWLHDLTTQHLTALGPGQGTELLVLSLAAKRLRPPAADGRPYRKGHAQ